MSDSFKDRLNAVQDLQSVEVEIPEWEMTFEIREPSAGAMHVIRAKYVKLSTRTERTGREAYEMVPECDIKDPEAYQFALLAAAMYLDGEKCFKDPEDAARYLGQRSPRSVAKLVAVVQGMTRKDLPVEDAEKNSETTA